MTAHGRLSLIVAAEDYDRVHYALAMASAAAATGRPTTLFFTLGALKTLLADRADGIPGWAALAPAAGGRTAIERDTSHSEAGIATIEELISACVELGTTIRVCEMALRAEGLSPADFRSDVTVSEGGLVSFLAEAERDNGQIVFI